MKRTFAVVSVVAMLAACGSNHSTPQSTTSALKAPSFGTTGAFAVLGGSAVTNTGPSTIGGDIGVDPGTSITGFPPGLQTSGAMHSADAVALQAQTDLTTAYNELAGAPCDHDLTDVDLGGHLLTSGVYCFASSAQLTGALTLDAKGDPNAVFIFQVGTTLTSASNASVSVINGGDHCNVFWQIGSSATLGTNTSFIGSIAALTSITMQTGATLDGRALARNGAVTLDTNDVALSTCLPTDAGVGQDTGIDTGTAGGDTGTQRDTGTGGGADTGTSGGDAMSDSGAADDASPSDGGAADTGCMPMEGDECVGPIRRVPGRPLSITP